MRIFLLRSTATVAIALSAAFAWGQDASKAAPAAGMDAGSPATVSAAGSNAVTSSAAPADYRLGPGDSIKVQVYQQPDLSLEARVSESGVVNYPLIGAVHLGGLTIPQAEARIADALKKGNILKAPQVTINVAQVRGNQVAVLGQVQKPGRFPMDTNNTRVSDMLAAAGGVSPTGDDVLVVTGTRGGKPFRQTVDIPGLFAGKGGEQDILVQPGDTLFVGKAPTFYIYGEAQRPGNYRIEPNMTVQQALAAGGGITPRGSQNRIRLTRTGPDGKKVESSARLDDPVQPGDVIFVRESIF